MSGSENTPGAQGIRAMLTEAGIDHSELDIRDDPTEWTDLRTGEPSTSVVVSGPREARREVTYTLQARGLARAPYPDRDEWIRPAQAEVTRQLAAGPEAEAGQ